jgi:hypothetical protein
MRKKKPGEVEKLSSFERNQAKFLSKIRDNLQNRKKEIYPDKVFKRGK